MQIILFLQITAVIHCNAHAQFAKPSHKSVRVLTETFINNNFINKFQIPWSK